MNSSLCPERIRSIKASYTAWVELPWPSATARFWRAYSGVGFFNRTLVESSGFGAVRSWQSVDFQSGKKAFGSMRHLFYVGNQPLQWVNIRHAGEVSGAFLKAASLQRNFRASLADCHHLFRIGGESA
jgi:hypothetical protein